MKRLLDKVELLNSEIILITPSIYDQTAKLEKENQFGVNDALAHCSEFLSKIAQEKGHGLIDFHGPMTRINGEQQESDESFEVALKLGQEP